MAHKTYKAATISIDDSTGSLTAITGSVNNASLNAAITLLEDSGLGDATRSFISGIAGGTIPLNGWSNSTTDGIFGPLVETGTSVTKTVSFYNGDSYYTGECLPSGIGMSGSVDSLMTWNADLTFTGAINRTSVAPS
jgi:hypothetical protein